MEANESSGKIRSFVDQFIGNSDFGPDQDLFESGLVNSLFAMQLVLFVEKEFGIQVANEDLYVENFKSLNAISDFVARKSVAAH